jgi:hypothetical protein
MDDVPGLPLVRTDEASGRRQKHAFTAEEDATLQQLVERFGERNWPEIERLMPGRTSRQCRERWNLYLSPEISLAPWTPGEDLMLARLHQILGKKWTVIAKNFPKRTPNNVKNRHKQLQRRIQRLSRFNAPLPLDDTAAAFAAARQAQGIVVPLGHPIDEHNPGSDEK